MNAINGLIKIGVGVKTLNSWIKTKAIEGADNIARNNPMVRIFLDSPIGSNIEKEVEKAYSTSWYKKIKSTIIGKLPDSVSVSLGKLIGQGTARVLDMTKLNYQLAKGWISAIQYRNELTKRTLCGTSTIINRGWALVRPFIQKGLQGILQYIGVPEGFAHKAATACSHALGLVKKEVSEFIKSDKVIEVTQNIVNAVSEGIVLVKEAGKAIVKKTTEVITTIATAAGKTVTALYEGAKSVGKKMYDSAKGFFKRLINV